MNGAPLTKEKISDVKNEIIKKIANIKKIQKSVDIDNIYSTQYCSEDIEGRVLISIYEAEINELRWCLRLIRGVIK